MRKLFVVISVVSAGGLLPFIILAFFNQPCHDDFWYTWMAKDYGFIGAIYQWSVSISGRYSSNAFMSLNSLVYQSLLTYKSLPVITIILWVAVFQRYLSFLFKPFLKEWQCMAVAFFCVAVYYWNIPSVMDGLFWASAVACYQLPLIIYALLFLLIIKNERRPFTFFSSILLWLAVLVAGGFHELIALMAVALGLAYLGFYWQVYGKKSWRGILFTVASGMSLSIQMLSVGNGIKAAQVKPAMENTAWVQAYFTVVLQTTYQIAVRVVFSPSFWLLAILICWLSVIARPSYKPAFTVLYKKKFVLYCSLLLAATLFPGILLMKVAGIVMLPRISNVAYFIFFSGSLAAIILFAPAFTKTALIVKGSGFFVAQRKKILPVLLIAGILSSRSLRYAATDLFSGSAYAYNQQMNNQFAELDTCISGGCIVYPLVCKPLCLYQQDIDATEKKWRVWHLEKIFHKKIVGPK